MPIDLCSNINSVGVYAYRNTSIKKIFGNSVILSFIIVLTMVLLIMIMYPAKQGTSFMVLVKMFFYMLVFTAVYMFLHKEVMYNDVKMNNKNEITNSVLGGNGNNSIIYNDRIVKTDNMRPSNPNEELARQIEQLGNDINNPGCNVVDGNQTLVAQKPPPPQKNLYSTT